jgi:spore maturation protein CgeB
VDPDLYLPLNVEQDIDVFFLATSDSDRQESVSMMISTPSECINARFLVSGIRYTTDLRNARKIQMLPFNLWRNYACRSKINLNITREKHASTYTSTSRPFELAAMGCCIVSSPYKGLEKWFRVGKEIFMANSSNEAIELYNWLLSDENLRREVAVKARNHVLQQHTFRQRANEILMITNQIK